MTDNILLFENISLVIADTSSQCIGSHPTIRINLPRGAAVKGLQVKRTAMTGLPAAFNRRAACLIELPVEN